ncbi:MAG: hypothetical protein AAGF59_05100 [Pseudomonadota bacterium]
MKTFFGVLALLSMSLLGLASSPAPAKGRIEVGVLECQVTGGSGLIVATTPVDLPLQWHWRIV